MNFMFSWQEQYLTRSLRSLVRYCSCHSNIKFISSRHRVISYSSFQIESLQRSLSDARENSARLSSTIESLMTSHTELQEAMERLQTDMGQKESELNILRRDKYVFYQPGAEKTYELAWYLSLVSFIF